MTTLVGRSETAELQARLEALLQRELKRTGDGFLPGTEYVRKWGYKVDKTGTLPTRP